jgi:hypothetical protein
MLLTLPVPVGLAIEWKKAFFRVAKFKQATAITRRKKYFKKTIHFFQFIKTIEQSWPRR